VLLLGLLLGAASAAAAQDPGAPDACAAALADAQQRYVDQDYASVEPLVLPCVSRPSASGDHLQRGYRLLTLAFIRQDLLHEAQGTILKLLGLDYDYEPDAVQDPPLYVALVRSIKDQLRVAAAPAGPALASAAPGVPAQRVNVNTATAAELEAVPGIGPVMAGRIVALRERQGPFGRLEDLDAVQGIAPRTLERLAPYLAAEPAAWTQRAAGGVPAAAPAPTARPEGAPPAGQAGAVLDLNTASAGELEALDGIGPALAARIVAYREQVGPFQRVQDVLEVRGIGPRTLERFTDRVTVGSPAE
jgi:competence protein ComEA